MKTRALALFLALICLAGVLPARALDGEIYPLEPTAPCWRIYDPALHAFYRQLTDAEKRVFSARYDCVALGGQSLWTDGGLGAEETMRVDYVLLTDCPELMYMPAETGLDGELLRPDEAYCAGHPDEIERMLADCRATMDAIARQPEWDDTDFGKQLAVDRFIAAHCRYDVEADFGGDYAPDPMLRTAWASLSGGKATCVGYAQGVQLALRCLGIPCLMAYGYVRDDIGRETPHSWNMVEVDGAWYHHDATWDDRDAEDYLPYFNLSTEVICRSHADDPARGMLGFDLPGCESMRANYYAVRGQTMAEDWRAALPRLVQEARDDGRNALGVRFEDEARYREALRALEAGELDDELPRPDVLTRQDVNLIWFRW